ncbi:phosphatase PAP2 family protein [Rhodococcus triatomae]|uniref:Undecaprenyl-diphosphatase n=2 Tax=Rhodococcus triatomae TaxID=300028 RepID=A0A1G8AU78_9NOCA|nr:phosphatase PAP2 family protein [Rhodococcus triatomae]QNG22650.1 phosphatase PAP2 family protein [Rhodococcus triatomae]SDH23880.1 undecaprenyl-diphosphatase [Rhodococcus triatomae]
MSVDLEVLDGAVHARSAWLVDAVTVFTHTGGTLAMWVASAVVVLALWIRARRADAVLVGAGMLGVLLVMSGLKRLFARERPPVPERLVDIDSYSFPSGHAMMTAAFVVLVAVVLARTPLPAPVLRVTWVLLALYTCAIGCSRLYLAAHWLTDVLAGWVFGVAWAMACVLIARWVSARRQPA